MQAVTTVGLDISKSDFQAHGVDAAGQVSLNGPNTGAFPRAGLSRYHAPS